jgi:hypothetical protein
MQGDRLGANGVKMVKGIERVVIKLLGTLNSNVDSCCYCKCLRGKRVRRKAFVGRSSHEGAGARTFLHGR